MAGKKKFINPLTRSSEHDLHLPPATQSSGLESAPAVTPTTEEAVSPQVKGKTEKFEEVNERFSGWMDKKLKKQFEALVKSKGASKTALLNEAITLLLHKQERKPYTRAKTD